MLYVLFLAEKFKERLAKIFAEKTVRGNSVQIETNFPPKNFLKKVYFSANFSSHFCNYLSEILLSNQKN